jgi:hypothetical protein
LQVKLSVHQSDNQYFLRSSKIVPKSHPYLSHTLKKAYSVKPEKEVTLVISADYPYHFKGKLYFHCDRFFGIVADSRYIITHNWENNHATVFGFDLSPLKIIFPPRQVLSSPAFLEVCGAIQANSLTTQNETCEIDETIFLNFI